MLFSWVKYHPQMEKNQLYAWITSLFDMLEAYHKSGAKAYHFVSPLSVVVTPSQELCLLDLEAASSRQLRTRMERRSFKEQFYPGAEKFYPDHESDYYSLGMTIQFILASTEPKEGFTKKEEYQLRHLLRACQKLEFTGRKSRKVVFKEAKSRLGKRPVVLALLSFLVLLVLGVKSFVFSEKGEGARGKTEVQAEEAQSEEREPLAESARLRFHTGLIYLCELRHYQRAGAVFGELFAEAPGAKYYADIATYLAGDKVFDTGEMEAILEKAWEYYPEDEEVDITETFVRTWALLDTPSSRKRLIEVAETAKNRSEELLLHLAGAYSRLGEKAEALTCFEELFTISENPSLEAYRRRATLLYESQEGEEAIALLENACGTYPQNTELRVLLVKYTGEREGRTEKLLQLAREQVKSVPVLVEDGEFKKLIKENGMKIEGGELCYEN